MTLMWKSNPENQPHADNENDKASLQKHNECMRKFRLAHPKVELKESKSISKIAWLALFPIQNVRPAKYSSN